MSYWIHLKFECISWWNENLWRCEEMIKWESVWEKEMRDAMDKVREKKGKVDGKGGFLYVKTWFSLFRKLVWFGLFETNLVKRVAMNSCGKWIGVWLIQSFP